jgi:hypothetical protein
MSITREYEAFGSLWNSSEFKRIQDQLRVSQLRITEEAAWRLIRRFVGPRCPASPEDALMCVNLMNHELQCIVGRDGSQTFQIIRLADFVAIDTEYVAPLWKLRNSTF